MFLNENKKAASDDQSESSFLNEIKGQDKDNNSPANSITTPGKHKDLLKDAAIQLLKNGIKVVVVNNNKRPVHEWKPLQSLKDNGRSVLPYLKYSNAKGIAVLCGACSNNLEVLDFDTKYDQTGTLFQEYMNLLKEVAPELADKLLIIETISGGRHFYFRCEIIGGNDELAKRPVTEEELKANPNETYKILIETRGEGGYAVAPPTQGYKVLQENPIPVISIEEREILFDLARSFHKVIEEVPIKRPTSVNVDGYGKTPWADYDARGIDHMVQLLQNHGWTIVAHKGTKTVFKRPGDTKAKTSGDYCNKLNLFTVFTTSSQFTAQKGYRPSAVYAILEHNGDFSAAAKALAQQGYGERKRRFDPKLEKAVFQLKNSGGSDEDVKQLIISRFEKFPEEAANIVKEINKNWGEDIATFWIIDRKEDGNKIVLLQRKFIDFLHEKGGFGLYYQDESCTSYDIVRVTNGLAEVVSTEQMIKFVMAYIDGLPDFFDGGLTPEKLAEAVTRQINSLFNDKILQILPRLELEFLKDTKDQAFLPFKNGIVSITADKIELMPYKSLNKVIWRKQIKQFEIMVDPGRDPKECEFYQFIELICNKESKRINYCLSLIGYLLHGFKDPSRPYAVILAEETSRNTDGGGTGKGVFWKGLQHVLRCMPVDGKLFVINKDFAFQRVSPEIQLIIVDDCKKDVDFETFNSLITEGITVEKKRKDEIFIPYADSPKILLTTNYVVALKGNHGKRRSKVFEFHPFFGPNKSVKDQFKKLFFDDWDEGEWNRFYNLMFSCLCQYLSKGIPERETSETLKMRGIKEQFGEEFAEEWQTLKDNLNDWQEFGILYQSFLLSNDFVPQDYSKKRFKKALETSAEAFGWKLEEDRNNTKNRKHIVMIRK